MIIIFSYSTRRLGEGQYCRGTERSGDDMNSVGNMTLLMKRDPCAFRSRSESDAFLGLANIRTTRGRGESILVLPTSQQIALAYGFSSRQVRCPP